MIRIVVVDDHPALRTGLGTVLRSEPGLVFAGESGGSEESVWPLLRTVRPDVVLLDYHLPKGDGLQLCYRIKQERPAPRVIVYTAYASADLVLPARLAGADALLSKALGARELFEAIRRVNAGESLILEPSPAALRDAIGHVPEEYRALVGMLLDGASESEAARTLGLPPLDVRHAVQRTLSALRLVSPAAHLV
jgi:DNA-binding NarL/FixJ family response regulator